MTLTKDEVLKLQRLFAVHSSSHARDVNMFSADWLEMEAEIERLKDSHSNELHILASENIHLKDHIELLEDAFGSKHGSGYSFLKQKINAYRSSIEVLLAKRRADAELVLKTIPNGDDTRINITLYKHFKAITEGK